VGPLFIIIPLLATDKLGYAPYAASNWCFIKDYNYSSLANDAVTVALILVGGKGWEFVSYVSVTLFYLLIFCHINQVSHHHIICTTIVDKQLYNIYDMVKVLA